MTGQKATMLCLLCTFLLCLPTMALAQGGDRGAISGLVLDASGGVVPGVAITVTDIATGTQSRATATSAGSFTVPALLIGKYRVDAEKVGFKRFVEDGVTVFTGSTTTVNINMEVGAVNQEVTVTATTDMLNTTDARISPGIESKLYDELPLALNANPFNGTGRRNPEQFVLEEPGASTVLPGNTMSMYFNGEQFYTKAPQIDGVGVLYAIEGGQMEWITPPYEALSEFRVETSNSPAEFGFGTFEEQMTFKSGTNALHGDLFEFHRDDALNSKGETPQVGPNSKLIMNEFGGTVGGPVYIPKLYNGKNKTFFFTSYEQYRKIGEPPTENTYTVPTAAVRQGDLSVYLNPTYYPTPIQVYNPVNPTCNASGAVPGSGTYRCAFPGNIVPVSSTLASNYIPQIALPNLPGTLGGTQENFLDSTFTRLTDPVWSVKIDHTFNDHNRVSWSYWYDNESSLGASGDAEFLSNNENIGWSFGGGQRAHYYATIRSNLVNDLYAGWTSQDQTGTTAPNQWTAAGNTLNAYNVPNFNLYGGWGAPGIRLDAVTAGGAPDPITYFRSGAGPGIGASTFATGKYSGAFYHVLHLGDMLDWQHGKHNVKFGFDYSIERDVQRRVGGGYFEYSADDTAQLGCGSTCGGTGDSWASFLIGAEDQLYGDGPNQSYQYIEPRAFWFVQDTWKVTSKLTASLGIRQELPQDFHERHDRLSAFSPYALNNGAISTTTGQPLNGALIFLGDGPGRTGTDFFPGNHGSHREFGPRIGLAYMLNPKTVVRAGYALQWSYGNGTAVAWNENTGAFFSGLAAYSIYENTPDLGVTPLYTANGYPIPTSKLPDTDPTQLNGSSIYAVDPGAGIEPYYQQWNIGVQHYLPHGFFVDAAYVGNHGSHLPSDTTNLGELPVSDMSTYGNLLTQPFNSPAAVAAGITAPFVGFSGTVAQALRPYPQYTGTPNVNDLYDGNGSSDYNAVQVQVRKTAGDVHLMLSFTGQKTLANMTSLGPIYTTSGELDTHDNGLMKGEMSEQTRMFTASWIYDVPVGKGKRFLSGAHGAVNEVIGGWRFGAVQTYHNGTTGGLYGGTPNPIFNTATALTGLPGWGVNRTHGCSGQIQADSTVAWTVHDVTEGSALQLGDVSPSVSGTRGCGYLDEDFTATKLFPIKERINVEFRAEFYNLFNRHLWNDPNESFGTTTTGMFTSLVGYYQPRLMQFALKLTF